jgi:hypothetical protein
VLSKSRYIRGVNCLKSLWLYANKREEQRFSERTLAIFARGTNAGELARQYFPGGVLAVVEGELPGPETAKRTQELIQQGVETIYEATFIHQETLVAVDILTKSKGGWHLIEVKSTNAVKEQHMADIAVQYYVVSGAGLAPAGASIMHFNRDYVRRGAVEIQKLFVCESVLKPVLKQQKVIQKKIPTLIEILARQLPPEVPMGEQCTAHYTCDFLEYCTKECAGLPVPAAPALSNIPEVEKEELRTFVASAHYPLYYLDFETMQPGIPLFDESRPYQQIPFQYSLHHQNRCDGEVFHDFFLAEADLNQDPRKALIEQLIADTQLAQSIFVYHIPFERSRIQEMMRDFPMYAIELQTIINKMIDLIIPFKRALFFTESMQGSSSIKKVLPALCPGLSYDHLEINNGMDASFRFLDLYYCDDPAEISKVRKDLLEYCKLDTRAMVDIFGVLRKV